MTSVRSAVYSASFVSHYPISPHSDCRIDIAARGAVSVRNTLGPNASGWKSCAMPVQFHVR